MCSKDLDNPSGQSIIYYDDLVHQPIDFAQPMVDKKDSISYLTFNSTAESLRRTNS